MIIFLESFPFEARGDSSSEASRLLKGRPGDRARNGSTYSYDSIGRSNRGEAPVSSPPLPLSIFSRLSAPIPARAGIDLYAPPVIPLRLLSPWVTREVEDEDKVADGFSKGEARGGGRPRLENSN